MPRYDKYDPYDGGFRAAIAEGVELAKKNDIFAATLDTAGRVVLDGTGPSGVVGVLVTHDVKAAGDIVDVMTDGEIVEMDGLNPGTVYYAQADGTIGAAATTTRVGHTVEATRLVVRVEHLGGAA